MRITKAGKRNQQDWNDADHAAAGHAFVAEPLFLALCNIRSSLANLEVANAQLIRIKQAGAQMYVMEAIVSLNEALEALKGQATQ